MSQIADLEGMTFRQLVRSRIDALGMNQLELAGQVGVNKSSVNRWFNGKDDGTDALIDSSKRADLIPALALALKVPMTLICDAMVRSGMLPGLQPEDGTSQPQWIEQDVLPEMEYLAGVIIEHPAFADSPHRRLVVDYLYAEWLKRNASDNQVILRFPVSNEVALRWYEENRLDTWASLPWFLSRVIMDGPADASIRPDPYRFAGSECDEALERMRDYENTKYAILDLMASYPVSAMGDDHIKENIRFFEMYCHVHTQWELRYDDNGEAHIPTDPVLHGMDKAAMAHLRARWLLEAGVLPSQDVIDDMMEHLDEICEQCRDGERCVVAYNQ